MAFEKLSAKDQEIVLQCMRATSAHVEDWEKHSRLGLGSDELKVVIDQSHGKGQNQRDEDFCQKRATSRRHVVHLGTLRNSLTASTSLV